MGKREQIAGLWLIALGVLLNVCCMATGTGGEFSSGKLHVHYRLWGADAVTTR